MQRSLLFIITAALFSFFTISCSRNITKTVNSPYRDITFKGRSIGIILIDSLSNAADKNTDDFILNNYGNFDNLFRDYFPRFLAEYSHAVAPCFVSYNKKYFTDVLTFRNVKQWEYIVSPGHGTIIKDPDYDNFDLILVLYRTTLKAFNGRVYKGNQGYFGQNGGRDGYLSITGRMLLWDNLTGNAISYGAFNITKFIPALSELTKRDFEDCLRLLIADITAETPIFDESKTAGLKKLQ